MLGSTVRFVSGAAVLMALLGAPSAAQENPYLQPDESWISIDGTVTDVEADAFTLDYGDGLITVEMDDGDRDADAYKLVSGDKVTVFGEIDDDLFQTTTIEASSVYVENIDTYFYSSAADEEDTFITMTEPVSVSRTVLQGMVTEVGEESFKLNTGQRDITVELDHMSYDPLDDEGYQKIEVGDYVSVSGKIEKRLFEDRTLVARSVTTLFNKN